MTEPQPDHFQLGRWAQLAHSEGRYADAKIFWDGAVDAADNPLDQGRYIRGFAVSSYRSDDLNMAFGKAQEALDTHAALLDDTPDVPVKLEYLESARVLGRMYVHIALLSERQQKEASVATEDRLARGAGLLELALSASDTSGVTGQHQINLYSDVVLGRRFNGLPDDQELGSTTSLARVARRLAWYSESPAASSANLGAWRRAKAVGKALYRAYAATAVDVLLRPVEASVRRRRIAVRVATLPGVL